MDGWGMLLTTALVIGVTAAMTQYIRSDLLMRIQTINSAAMTTMVRDKETLDVVTVRLGEAEREMAELRVRVNRLERLLSIEATTTGSHDATPP